MRTGRFILLASSALTLAHAVPATAQVTGQPDPGATPSEQAGAGESGDENEVTVTGSRIARAGFDQPTPTTVIGDVELRQGARANIAQVLNDQPQFRATVSPAVSVGNTSSGTAPVDLRGLGTARTLTLLNGRRFVGEGNLNLIPSGLIERVEVVTGGASAAWGSNAVAGVVNILLDTKYDGLSVGGAAGVSSRGDAARYQADAKFGTSFAGGNGRIIAGVEYVDDRGVTDRNSRRNLGSANFVRVNPTSATDLSTVLARDVNYVNRSGGGVVVGGALGGQTFNPDGTIRSFQGPNANVAAVPAGASLGVQLAALGVGGTDAIGLYDDVYGTSPFERVNGYARVSYDIGDATVYAEGLYGKAKSTYPFFPDLILSSQSISAANPFVRPEVRARLTAAGQANFTVGRVFNDIFLNTFDLERENREGSIGVDGNIGERFTFNAYGSYGEVESNERVTDSRIAANYTRAVNVVTGAAGQPVCAVNADAIATNDDPACSPLNILGSGAASAASLAYVRGVQSQRVLNKLTSFGFQIQGDVFRLPGGPLAVAVGVEGRKEEQTTLRDPLTRTPGYFGFQLFAQDFGGEFSVKEGFVEVAAPVFNIEGTAKLDLNGAARYSDFSTSGGITTWKGGGTLRLFDDLLFRATRSRDIRSPGIGNLFSTRGTTIGVVADRDSAGRAAANPNYNSTPTQVFTFSGGNPDLDQERADTLVLGASYSPGFLRGFNLSVDYYDIEIEGAITTLNGSQLTLACVNGNQAACDRVVRDTTGTITTVFANAQNIASFKTRGIDIEAAYLLQMSDVSQGMAGSLRLRALATYVDRFITNDGTSAIDRVGDVGNTVVGVPEWRGTFSATYQTDEFGLDARVRYVDGGLFDSQPPLATTLVNNRIKSRTYLDLGAQFKVADRFTLFGNVNNVFDRDPPLVTAGTAHYDVVGTYFLAGARVNF
ncbi:TonB-dependent receptor plug domain-containing protein [uncultured Sphingomonas sp.]|uniref:TonB-dependent receptor plug domain-containing protein n=1 Tax=uncultured Sphingomonas sp. TaxID=158754 RepID=UPI0035CACE75